MDEPELMLRRAWSIPVRILLLVSLMGASLVGLRIVWTGDREYVGLVWNLFLAWLPLVFAVAACRQYGRAERGDWGFYVWALLWLLFLPNSSYIFTDIVHVQVWFWDRYWSDLCLILLIALTGYLVGFLSLLLMHAVVTHWRGRVAGWLFVFASAALASFGVYLGRFQRRNSWDVLVHPLRLGRSLKQWAVTPMEHPGPSIGFPILFTLFLFLGYLMLYALLQVRPAVAGDKKL